MSQLSEYLEKQGELAEQLAQAAEQIPAGLEGWRPCEGALGWLRLVDHMAIARRNLVLKAIKEEPIDFGAMVKNESLRSSSPTAAAAAHRSSWAELRSFLESQGEGFLDKVVTFTRGRQWPVSRILWFAFEENLHHRGQLWIYARMNGLTPPKVWGTEGMVQ
ncbi:MAG: DinB family protein [Nitrospinota bacterium]|nr:DinB family protein [Nitrospinota bacterium]